MPLVGTSHKHAIWLCTDGCGLTCATVTWTLHVFAWSTVTKLVIRPWFGSYSLHEGIYTLLTALSLLSHGRAMLTDPGAVPKDVSGSKRERERESERERGRGVGRGDEATGRHRGVSTHQL